jgi:hypothetical protein
MIGPPPLRLRGVLRRPSVTISRGPFENPVHGAAYRGGGRCCLLRRGGRVAFHQARALFEDHAALYPVARGDGADQRRVRDPRRARAVGAGNAPNSGVGTSGAADRGLSGQHLYGDVSVRGGCGRHRTVAEVGALPLQALLIWWLVWCTRPRYVLR